MLEERRSLILGAVYKSVLRRRTMGEIVGSQPSCLFN